jgi:hypothetical protein
MILIQSLAVSQGTFAINSTGYRPAQGNIGAFACNLFRYLDDDRLQTLVEAGSQKNDRVADVILCAGGLLDC